MCDDIRNAHEKQVSPGFRPLFDYALAQVVNPWHNRKALKPPIMADLYGITPAEAKAQIHENLGKLFPHWQRGLLKALAKIQYGRLQPRLNKLCPSRAKLKAKFKQWAEAAPKDKIIKWTSQLGMLVEQRYWKPKTKTCRVPFVEPNRVNISSWVEANGIDRAKQSRAFAANFIHSLDATFMMRVMLACKTADIPVAAAHDAFWCLPSDMERLNGIPDGILHREFYELHSTRILDQLHTQLETHYGMNLPPAEYVGALSVQQVLKSRYFCS